MEKFIEIPNLPKSNVSLAVVDGRVDKEIEEFLYNREVNIIKTYKNDFVYDAISYHPDIIMCHVGDKQIVVAKNTSNKFVYKLEEKGFEIIEGKNEVSEKYPLDVFYNVCIDKDCVICNEKYTDEILLEKLYEKGKSIINVKQGYTKCSTLIVDSGIFVTSDKGIHTILIREKKKSLLISPKHIELFNMNYGFIGGASGKIAEKEVAFYGNILLHKDGDIINRFLTENGFSSVSLSKNKLIDLGTLIPLKEYNDI